MGDSGNSVPISSFPYLLYSENLLIDTQELISDLREKFSQALVCVEVKVPKLAVQSLSREVNLSKALA